MRIRVALLALGMHACAMSNSFAVRIGKVDKELTACKASEPEEPIAPPAPPAPKRVSKRTVKAPKAVCASED